MSGSEHVLYSAGPQDAGERIDAFVARTWTQGSRAAVQRAIACGGVLRNGKVAAKSERLHSGDQIAIHPRYLTSSEQEGVEPQSLPLELVYEDDYLVAVNKPAGMVVHPGNGNRSGTLVNALAARMTLAEGFGSDRPGIVHRLDKETSGIILVARTQQIHAALAAQFAARTVRKWYLGFCIGQCPPASGIIDAPLARERSNPLRRTVNRRGKQARTAYWLLGYHSGVALMRFYLHTGRNHQIRAHCAARHLPIIRDTLYTEGNPLQRLEPLERPQASRIVKCFARQALHAHRITFTHPVNGVELDLRTPLPPDFLRALDEFAPHIDTPPDDFPAYDSNAAG